MKSFNAMGAAQARKQAGFTIIELVVVILLLGILTATALPRFLDLSQEAHDAVMDGVRGAFTSGLALYKAEWFARGQPTLGSDMSADFGNLVPNGSGFPAGLSVNSTDSDPLGNAIDDNLECAEIFTNIMDVNTLNTLTLKDTAALVTAVTSLADSATAIASPSATDFEEADSVAGDIWALMTVLGATENTGTCAFYYMADPQRVDGSAPFLTYNSATGALTLTN